jgi:hypothetical protein
MASLISCTSPAILGGFYKYVCYFLIMRKSTRLKSLIGKPFFLAKLHKPSPLVIITGTFSDMPDFVEAKGIFKKSELAPSPYGKH